jgi:hypothetical protein
MSPPSTSLRRNKAVGSPAAGLRLLEQVLLAATSLAVAGTFTDALAAAPAREVSKTNRQRSRPRESSMKLSLIVSSLLLLVGSLWSAPAPTTRYLFLDPSFVREAQGATLVVNPPQSSEIVIRADKPWEEFMITFYLSVIDDGGKLRMWYICRDRDKKGNVAYAEAIDGVRWTKPELGVHEYHGSRANNLVGIHNLEGNVFRDDHTADPQERYVYVSSVGQGGGIFRFTSPDGYSWKRDQRPLLPFEADSQNVTFWDARLGKYISYLRGWNLPKLRAGSDRKVVRLESERLDRPSGVVPAHPRNRSRPTDPKRDPFIRDELPDALVCDEQDPPDTDIYTNAIQPYPLDPSWYVGFPAFYRHDVNSRHRNDGWTEIQFVGSRDGKEWQRYSREPYLKPGLAATESGSMHFIGPGLVVRGDEIWQYGTGYRTTHGDVTGREQRGDGTIFRHVHRVDGFVSLDFASSGGRAFCAPVKVTGTRLLLNIDTGALGEVRVALRNLDGTAISGHGIDDCSLMRGNATGLAVTWRGSAGLAALQDRDVQVEFEGRRTKLYSIRFE